MTETPALTPETVARYLAEAESADGSYLNTFAPAIVAALARDWQRQHTRIPQQASQTSADEAKA